MMGGKGGSSFFFRKGGPITGRGVETKQGGPGNFFLNFVLQMVHFESI